MVKISLLPGVVVEDNVVLGAKSLVLIFYIKKFIIIIIGTKNENNYHFKPKINQKY